MGIWQHISLESQGRKEFQIKGVRTEAYSGLWPPSVTSERRTKGNGRWNAETVVVKPKSPKAGVTSMSRRMMLSTHEMQDVRHAEPLRTIYMHKKRLWATLLVAFTRSTQIRIHSTPHLICTRSDKKKIVLSMWMERLISTNLRGLELWKPQQWAQKVFVKMHLLGSLRVAQRQHHPSLVTVRQSTGVWRIQGTQGC